jgi:hypothetical protein
MRMQTTGCGIPRRADSCQPWKDATRILATAAAILIAAPAARADYPQIRVNHDTTTQLQNEQQVCINPTNLDNLVACWRDFRLGYRQVGVGYSMDGGATWTDYLVNAGSLPWTSDPVLTVHRDGTFYLVNINYQDGAANTLTVVRSTTGGVSWEGPFTAVSSDGSTFEDKEWIAVDRTGGLRDGNVYIAWSRFYDVKVMFVRSTDRGTTWSAPVQVSDAGVTSQWPVPIVARNGNIVVAWDNYNNNSITYDISTNGGTSWGTDRALTSCGTSIQSDINGGITVFPYSSLVMDETPGIRGGWIYCVYADQAVSANAMDIWCRRSVDNGNTWSAAVRVNDDPAGLFRDQFHPWATCDEFGVLHASWYDRRDDPSNYLWHIYYAKSTDGGATWSPSIRVTNVPSSPGSALRYVPDQSASTPAGHQGLIPLELSRAGLIGEYSGIAAGRGIAHPVWTDTRNGNQDTYTSILRDPAASEDAPAVVAGNGMRGIPNPGRAGGEIRLVLPSNALDADGVVEIVDPAGRVVRSLRMSGSGGGDLRWDGRDQDGREAPAGVYYARATGTGIHQGARTKIVLTR